MTNVLRRAYRPFVSIASVANAIGTLVIFLLVTIMNIDVIARGIFHSPLRGVVEVVIFSLILIVFLQLPDVVHNNRLTRSDGFLAYTHERYPKISSVTSRIIDCASAIFMGLIAWTIWPEFTESIASCHFITPPEFGPTPSGNFLQDLTAAMDRCEYFGTPGIFTAPWWPAKLAIFFSTALCAIIFAFKVILGNRTVQFIDKENEKMTESPV